MRCSDCAADNLAGARFCSNCGKPLAPKCAECGAELAPNARFCSQCGASLPPPATIPAPFVSVPDGERRHLTVLFCDLAGSTAIAAGMDPEDWRNAVAAYHRAAAEAITRYGGHVAKYLGDGVMAFWGAPTPLADHARLACQSALEAQESLLRLNQRWQEEGCQPFHTRMGIHTGVAIVGNVGFEGRMNYTVIGDSVNLASRLEGLNKVYGTRILISAATRQAAGAAVVARPVDLVAVKGKDQAIGIFELLAMRTGATVELLLKAEASAAIFDHYRNQRWDEALRLLDGLPQGPDGPLLVLAERCRQFRDDPPGPGWDGVWRFHEK